MLITLEYIDYQFSVCISETDSYYIKNTKLKYHVYHLLSEAILAEFEAGSLILALHEANRKCKDFEANARLKSCKKTGWETPLKNGTEKPPDVP